jgi:hypothetical protein
VIFQRSKVVSQGAIDPALLARMGVHCFLGETGGAASANQDASGIANTAAHIVVPKFAGRMTIATPSI